jgi:hypothetical protein
MSLLAEIDPKSLHALVAIGAVLLAIMAGGVALLWLRKRVRSTDRDGGKAFEIEQLEGLLRAGAISLEEYRRLRRAALGLDSGGGKKDDSSLSDGRKTDEEDRGVAG